jgi:hypothetical protein
MLDVGCRSLPCRLQVSGYRVSGGWTAGRLLGSAGKGGKRQVDWRMGPIPRYLPIAPSPVDPFGGTRLLARAHWVRFGPRRTPSWAGAPV